MSAFLAKKLGAKKTIIIVNNYTYINILPKNFVDIALSPQRLTVSMVLQHLAKGDVPQEVIFKMQSGAEAIEGIIHKNKLPLTFVGFVKVAAAFAVVQIFLAIGYIWLTSYLF